MTVTTMIIAITTTEDVEDTKNETGFKAGFFVGYI